MKKGMYIFLVSISCFCLCMSFFIVPVKAESDIFYPDPDSYIAYEYFFNHGYSHLILSTSGNVTYNVNLDNNGTNNGTITGTDALSGSSHNTGTINSTASTLGSKYMTCTTNNAVSGTQTYSCYFSSRSSGVENSQSITLKMNENTYSDYGNVDVNVNETIKQTINTDIVGTITSSTSSSHFAELPWLEGTYIHPSSFSWSDNFNVDANKDAWLIFVTTTYQSGAPIYAYYPSGRDGSDLNIEHTTYALGFGLTMYKIHVKYVGTPSGSANVTIDFPWLTNYKILPIYCGPGAMMTDYIRERVGITTKTNEILLNGNNYTESKVNSANNANTQVSNKITQFDNIENNSVSDMNSKISNLNLTSDILSNSKFLSSAQWVKTQFDRMTVSTPIGSVLSFSMILGMTLIFLGKIR